MFQYQYLLLQTVVVPLVLAAVCYLAAARLGKKVGWIAAFGLSFTTIALLLFGAGQVFTGGQPLRESYPWAGAGQASILTFGFLADDLSFPVVVVMNLVLAATAIYSMPYMEKRIHSLYGGPKPARFGLY